MSTILLVGVDLFMRGKLEAALPGHHFIDHRRRRPADLVVADIARVDPDEVADAYPDVPILGFTNHTDTAGTACRARGRFRSGRGQVGAVAERARS